ncbi:MAG: DNA methyltransferase [Chloroflexota bacterium]
MSHINLYWHNYKYFPYEKEMALREIRSLLKPELLVATENELLIEGTQFNEDSLQKLVYFQGYSTNGFITPTRQHQLERTCAKTGKQKKQSTRYSVHGLHEYKGKFNPQIVRGILNVLDVPDDATVLDPFCGSGTTLVECAHANMNAFGFDVNPMAVFVSNAKLQALSVDANQLSQSFEWLLTQFRQRIPTYKHPSQKSEMDTLRFNYLAKWFSASTLAEIECLRLCILDLPVEYQSTLLTIASNVLRDYSLQEPSDLRVRRRRSPMPTTPIIEKFRKDTTYFLTNLTNIQRVLNCTTRNQAFIANNQQLWEQWQSHQPAGTLGMAI